MKGKTTDSKKHERLECAAHWYLETAATGYCYKYDHGNCTLLHIKCPYHERYEEKYTQRQDARSTMYKKKSADGGRKAQKVKREVKDHGR